MGRLLRSRALWGSAAMLMTLGAVHPTTAGAPPRLRIFSFVRTRAHAVALTLDDGPDPDLTPRVIALLRRYGARATFFVTGSHAAAHPDLIAEELSVGEIGNHTWDHADLTRVPDDAVRAEIDATDAVLESLLWEKPVYFRPPFGRLPRRAERPLERAGHEVVRWNLAVDRYRRHRPDAGARAALAHVGPGSILLAHDACPPRDSRSWCVRQRLRSLAVLDRMLARLTAGGWRVVTVSELRAMAGRAS